MLETFAGNWLTSDAISKGEIWPFGSDEFRMAIFDNICNKGTC